MSERETALISGMLETLKRIHDLQQEAGRLIGSDRQLDQQPHVIIEMLRNDPDLLRRANTLRKELDEQYHVLYAMLDQLKRSDRLSEDLKRRLGHFEDLRSLREELGSEFDRRCRTN